MISLNHRPETGSQDLAPNKSRIIFLAFERRNPLDVAPSLSAARRYVDYSLRRPPYKWPAWHVPNQR